MPNRKTLFISDLHLDVNQPHSARVFLQLLANPGSNVDAIYILGDLFEAWIGDDHHTEFNDSISKAMLAATQRGLPIYFMHGNRDFLIGKQFAQATGCRLLAEEEKINLYGTPVLLLHGDTLCTQDTAYLRARKILRTKWLQQFFLFLPLSFRKKLADFARVKSKQHTQSAPQMIMDVTPAAVYNIMQQYNVKFLIHGHTHRPGIHDLSAQHLGQRIVLGAWHEQGNALIWDETGEKKLVAL